MIDKVITKFEDYTTIICFSLMSIITLAGVFCRYVLSNPIIWGEEVSRYLMIWGIFIGLSIVTRKKAQLGIDVLIHLAPTNFNKIIGMLTSILLILTYLGLFIISLQFVLTSKDLGQLTPILRIKFYYIYLAMPIGFILCMYRSTQIFINSYIKNDGTKKKDESEVYMP